MKAIRLLPIITLLLVVAPIVYAAAPGIGTPTLSSSLWVDGGTYTYTVQVTDTDLWTNLNYVTLKVDTLGSAETFTLRWTESTRLFSEDSDTSGICTLGSSTWTQISGNVVQLAFTFTVNGGTEGAGKTLLTAVDETPNTTTRTDDPFFFWYDGDANDIFVFWGEEAQDYGWAPSGKTLLNGDTLVSDATINMIASGSSAVGSPTGSTQTNPNIIHVYGEYTALYGWSPHSTDYMEYSATGIYANSQSKISPYGLTLGAIPYANTFAITDMEGCGNWVFAEEQYYTFQASFIHNWGWEYVENCTISLHDGYRWVNATVNVPDQKIYTDSGSDAVNLRYIRRFNTTLYSVTVEFGVYFTSSIRDTADVDVYASSVDRFWNTQGPDLVGNDYFNIYNHGGVPVYSTTGANAVHYPRMDPLALRVSGGAGTTQCNMTYRSIDSVHLLTQFEIPAHRIDSAYSSEKEVEYGIYYCVGDTWIKGWNVKLIQSNGFTSSKDFWIYVQAYWYRNGVQISNTTMFSSFYKPGGFNATTIWVDLWFSQKGAAAYGAGRVSAEYYGMQDATTWWQFWYTDWGPMLSDQTMSYYEMPLVDENNNEIRMDQIKLCKVYSRLSKPSSSDQYTVGIRHPNINEVHLASGAWTGVNTPVFEAPKIMDMPQSGFLAPLVAVITDFIMRVTGVGSFINFIRSGLLSQFLDTVFTWFGWQNGFTTVSGWFTTLFQYMISSIGWVIQIIPIMFNFFAVTVPSIIWTMGVAFTTWIDLINMAWSMLTGVYSSGFNFWVDFNGPAWVQLAAVLYPAYLYMLYREEGFAAMREHLDFVFWIVLTLLNVFMAVGQMVWGIIFDLINAIPVVE